MISNTHPWKERVHREEDVYYSKQLGVWVAYIHHYAKKIFVGQYNSREEAEVARDAALGGE